LSSFILHESIVVAEAIAAFEWLMARGTQQLFWRWVLLTS